MRSLPPGGAVRRGRRAARRARSRWRPRASAGWAPTRTPTAACCCATCELPDFRDYAVDGRRARARRRARRRACSAASCATSMRAERRPANFRVFGPDETASNRLGAVFEATDRAWDGRDAPTATTTSPPDGRVMEVLSRAPVPGLAGGLPADRPARLFNCYEAFIHIVDSMFNQHAKWLKVTREIPWRRPIASLNYLLVLARLAPGPQRLLATRTPGFIDHVVNKKAEIVRVYLPPDANCLLSVADHCLRSRDYVNVIVAGKQPALDYLSMDEAVAALHARPRHLGVGEQRRRHGEPDVVLACAGDVPTLETLAAAATPARAPAGPEGAGRQRRRPDAPAAARPSTRTASPTREFDALFTTDRPVIFAYHGYPWLIHRLTYRRTNHHNLHVRGYKEEGTTTTPFDMVMLNDLDRFHLVMDVIDRVPGLGQRAARPAPADGRRAPAPARATRASTARTRPRCATGLAAGRPDGVAVLVVNAGSSSLKLRLLDGRRRAARRPRPAAPRRAADARPPSWTRAGRRASTPSGTGSCTAASASASAVADRRRRRGRAARADRPRAAAPAEVARRRSTPCRRVLPDVPAVACFDTAFHAHAARGGRDLRAPARPGASAGACGASASTGSRTRTPRGGPRAGRRRRSSRCHLGAGASLGAVATAARSTRRWASRRSRAWSWRPARAASTPAWCCGCWRSTRACAERELARGARARVGPAGARRARPTCARCSASAERGDADARLALDVYVHRLRAGIAAMAAALGGLDALVFTGGVGEHAPGPRGTRPPASASSASRSTRRATPPPTATPTSARAGRGGAHARGRRPRGPRDRAPGPRRGDRQRAAASHRRGGAEEPGR